MKKNKVVSGGRRKLTPYCCQNDPARKKKSDSLYCTLLRTAKPPVPPPTALPSTILPLYDARPARENPRPDAAAAEETNELDGSGVMLGPGSPRMSLAVVGKIILQP